MREIKFRTPMLCQRGHFRWWYSELRKGEYRSYWGTLNCKCPTHAQDAEFKPIGDDQQYTVLKDRTGKEIYEGDIVKGYVASSGTEPVEVTSAIVFSEGSFIHYKVNDEPMILRDSINTSNSIACNAMGVEIIGNIYQNPELLTKKTS